MSDEFHLGAARHESGMPHAGLGKHVLLVGMDNPISDDPENALYNWPRGCAGYQLCSHVLDLPGHVYLGIWRTNLCTGGWNAKAARARAKLLTTSPDMPWRVVVALGSDVGRAMPAELEIRGVVRLVRIPHPSRRNTRWNDPAYVTAAREAVREFAPELWQEAG